MPSAAITSANSGRGGKGMDERPKEPHERPNGPWTDWELADGARHLEHADKISKNKKYAEAIKKHAETKAAEHHAVASHAARLARSGHISEKQMERLKKR